VEPKRSVTIADIALRAGVAVSTVSYALSGKRSISAETRARIEQAVAELDFKPHAVGRALASRSSHTMALFFPASRNTLQVENHIFLAGVAEATSKAGYGLLVSTSHDPAEPASLIETGTADCALLMEVTLHDERVARLRASGRPFGLIGHSADNSGVPFVDFDFEEAIRTAARHLRDLGHRHIALLNRQPERRRRDYGPAVRSRTAFRGIARDLGFAGEHLLCSAAPYQYRQIDEFLRGVPTCTAAITLSSTFAPLLRVLTDLGREVPRDFSVVSVIAPEIREIVHPALTTIDLPAVEMGRLGAEALLNHLADPSKKPGQVMLHGELNIGATSAPPRAATATELVLTDTR